ncbi:PIN domain-containing protein [Beggiatoa leptomitoformis]|uniref:PIN domain-containing protein n=1 Tax=Beggiatoa leptomitoformis TaxID=288004 RepID=A0A2N9YBR8_9GAMM|nr:PIN domain-containing protein [Beggiatoa leptomitoformis]ALG66735.1 PIN domain-containing protein [Beggiatoa leptomitoformis]AUI67928.1 PIN domain-containing protein [Beggiatoa leptomitoformis]
MASFSVICDACVLYPAPLRDLLMRLALADLFKAHWTDKIHEEWINALLRQNKYKRDELEKVRDLMDKHIKDAKVDGYETLINGLSLPDENDRHVLAAAIKINADAIITFNTKDFPSDVLNQYAIEVIHPDDFIFYQLELNSALCFQAIKEQRQTLKNPPKTAEEFLRILQKQSLQQTVSKLAEYINFI